MMKVVIVGLALALASVADAQSRTTRTGVAERPVAWVALPSLPSVVGLTADSAGKVLGGMLAKARVPLTTRDSSTNAAPANHVLQQEPPGGTPLSRVRAVILVLATPVRKGPIPGTQTTPVTGGIITPPRRDPSRQVPPPPAAPSTTVPELFGRDESTTVLLLKRATLRLERPVVTQGSDLADSGFVFHQEPAAKERVDTGSLVKVWMSLGPHRAPSTVKTPRVVGQTLERAERLLRDAGLNVGHVDRVFRSSRDSLIEHQLPEEGAPAHRGDSVALRIAMVPQLIAVPSLIGLRSSQARDTLRKLGLVLGQVTPVIGRANDTSIVSQNPRARSEVQRGTYVDVEENQRPIRRRTAVPSLLGMTRVAAAQRLASDSLVLGRVVVSDNGSTPRVIKQQPEPEDSAFLFDSVDVTLKTPLVVPVTPTPTQPTSVVTPPTPAVTPPTPVVIPPAPLEPQAPPEVIRPPAESTVTLVTVPEVRNLTDDSARAVLNTHGLTSVMTSVSTGRSQVVTLQDPEPGSLVVLRAEVRLQLAPVSVRRPPNLVGLRRAAAAAHATGDGFAMSVQSSRRVFLRLFERVAAQEPDTVTIGRGDQVIHVDLAIPLIPPIPGAIVLVLMTAGIATLKPRPPSGSSPLIGLSVAFDLPAPSPPVPSLTANDSVIRSAVTFTLDAGRGEWQVESNASSIIAHVDTHV